MDKHNKSVWLTRDTYDGALSDMIHIWGHKPVFISEGPSLGVWFNSFDRTYQPLWKVDLKWAKDNKLTIPDDQRQCIRMPRRSNW
jgi:hypothetical protein